MRRKELLQVEERDLNVARLEELPELFVHDENASIVRMLQTVFGNVLGEKLGNFTSGNQFSRRKTDKFAKLIGDFLLTVETVVSRARSRLGSVRVVLLSLDLTNNLGEGLNVGAESGNFGLNFFKRHDVISFLLVSSLSVLTTLGHILVTHICAI